VRDGIGSALAWRSIAEVSVGVEMRRFNPPRKLPIGFYHTRKPSVQVRTLLAFARQVEAPPKMAAAPKAHGRMAERFAMASQDLHS
jgi:hypothetical protein